MKTILKFLVLLVLGWQVSAPAAFAVEPDEVLKDPVLEKRARLISKDLRCLVCQNQSIDDSNADLAKDLRILVRERLKKGDTNSQVVQYLVDRYGEFVLLKPRLSAHTWVMWFAAPIILLLAGFGFFRASRRRKALAASPAPALSEEEKKRIDEIMQEQ
ncbi:MAG TPA: cytochrome c-type biogenesis protein CcmH [Rhizobiales bacterium]|nr:cytochrome c-type biogenesis protein CcmH [Hyphomicrobiales bacterium]